MAKLLTGTRIYGTGTVDTQLFVSGTNSATSTITGALQVVGGVGIGGNIAIGGALYAGGTTGTNGQVLTSTGNGISWTTISGSFNGGTITSPLIINNSTGASSTNTGALQITNGGIGVGGSIFVGGVVTATTFIGNLTGTASTATAAATAYALANTGSTYVGFANQAVNATNVNGGTVTATAGSFSAVTTVTNATNATSTTTGALQVVGGVGIGGNVAIGGALYAGGTTGTNGQILTSTGNGISWTTISGSFNGGTITSPLIINNSTGASSTNTGALQITNGGIGVGGSIFVGGVVTATTFIGNLTGTASTATSAATAFALANTGSTYVGFANLAANLLTAAQTANANYFLTFVDANNATPLTESVYTTSSFSINPSSGGVRIGGVTTVTNTTNATSTITGALQVVGGMGVGRDLWVGAGVYAATKSFLIDHPSKPGWKLVHGSLEGPENGVYIRGKIVGSNKIHLPDYWINLVDFDTITVNLTPIGKYQQLFVERVEGLEITIANAQDTDMNFFYTVWAERIDVDKLRVEVN